jgi:xylose isomerase
MAVDYRNKIGLKAQFLIEPKPKEPTAHQYDSDCAACMAFLKTYGLEKEFKFNIETNHATLAGHSMGHELAFASSYGLLGSIDANRGDELLGWDTDQFPTNLYTTTQVMLAVLGQGGLGQGGLNFDAKVRRESFEPVDLFYAHIGAMDCFAQGLKVAAAIRKDGKLTEMVNQRYSSWEKGIGLQISEGSASFESLEKYMLEKGEAEPNVSGRQELFESVLNRYIS